MLQLLQARKRCQLQREGLEPGCSCLKITSWTKSQSDSVEHVRPLFISRSFLSYWQSCEVSNCPIILYGHRSKKSTKCRFQFCPGKCYRPSWLSYRWTASFSIAWINDDSVDDMTTSSLLLWRLLWLGGPSPGRDHAGKWKHKPGFNGALFAESSCLLISLGSSHRWITQVYSILSSFTESSL